MKSKDYPFLEEFGDHPIFEDKDLFHKMWRGPFSAGHMMWKGPFIAGYIDEVFVPTRAELFVLFKDWYEELQASNFYLHYQVSRSELNHVDDVNRRLNLIAKFLPKEEVEAVCKEMDEEQRKQEAKRLQDIEKEIQVLSDEKEMLEEAVCKQMDGEERKREAKRLQDIEKEFQVLSDNREVHEKRRAQRTE